MLLGILRTDRKLTIGQFKVICLVQKNAANFNAVYSGIKIAYGTFEGKFFATSNPQEHTFKIIVEAARK
jgi:hypothetical protein